jgi:hypothetical protein
MSDEFNEFSWGPEKRARRGGPAPGAVPALVLMVAIVVMVIAGITGVAIHHPKAATPAAVTPAGFQPLVDTADHLRLAVPKGWQVLPVTTGQLTSNLNALKASDPQLAPLLGLAQAGLQQVQPGVFAIDATTRTSLFTYGVAAGGVRQVSDIPTAEITAPLTSIGAHNVTATRIRLAIGDVERVTALLTVGAVVIAQLLDYFVLHGRVVVLDLASRGAQAPTTLSHQIEESLAPAP